MTEEKTWPNFLCRDLCAYASAAKKLCTPSRPPIYMEWQGFESLHARVCVGNNSYTLDNLAADSLFNDEINQVSTRNGERSVSEEVLKNAMMDAPKNKEEAYRAWIIGAGVAGLYS